MRLGLTCLNQFAVAGKVFPQISRHGLFKKIFADYHFRTKRVWRSAMITPQASGNHDSFTISTERVRRFGQVSRSRFLEQFKVNDENAAEGIRSR